jgi:tetratricopeptide (TPR) repeat protein
MSLLIKALESAEKGKQAELKRGSAEAASSVDLGLEPLSTPEETAAAEAPSNKADAFNAAAAASVAKVKQQSEVKKDHKQQVAANVFVANQAAKNSTSASMLLLLGAVGALLIWLGLQGYQYMAGVNTSEALAVKPAPQVAATTEPVSNDEPAVQAIAPASGHVQTLLTDAAQQSLNTDEQVVKPAVNSYAGISTETTLIRGNTSAGSNTAAAKKSVHGRVAESGSPAHENAGELNMSAFNKSTPLRLVSRTPAAGVDPTLLAAYEAYSRGDDVAAQKQYRQVLQADIRNVDALLGMAAIALRQSRYADANGWYQKVLEIEPRNSTALSAVANAQINSESAASASADYAGTESRIKSMLAQQPEAANLHAALGNLYAAQSQWSLAQVAYFNASRYAPDSADYAFNLAVSLDQLGKSGLALAQYQRALGLLSSSGAGNLDKAELEARIQALQ